MDLTVRLGERGGRTSAIYAALVAAMTDGRLHAGDRLPPTRQLAAELGVSRTTVSAAYDRLMAEGYVEARTGAGTFVSAAAAPADPPVGRADGGALRPRASWSLEPLERDERTRYAYDFRPGIPDARLFPLDVWRRLVGAQLRRSALPEAYAGPFGHAGLRAAVARHLGRSRGVLAEPDDVIVCNGSQQALDLVCRVLVEAGDQVAVEDPGYDMARRAVVAHGARVVPVPVDRHGLRVDRIPPGVRLVLTTPSHQYPTGVPMTLARRRALLAWADQHDAAVFEDDYDSEFRYGSRPLEPLYSLDATGRVLYAGTFSKSLLPSLRLGYLLAPAGLRPALAAARQVSDWHGVLPVQAALAHFIDDGLLGAHVRRANRVYAARRDAMTAGVRDHLGEWFDTVPSAAGLHLCVRLRAGLSVDDRRLAAELAGAGVGLEPLSPMYGGAAHPGLVLGYGLASERAIAEGLPAARRVVRRCVTAS
ncbi:MocR-like pyridoxine biosynthesis transcription factor PdxR [Luteipulveratus flavus]|uniref:PLP-dependent aminotransferase family protein n=1 Tax=Luteipulveratus flavus TaxID=3031728 RepID=A0ABT6C5Z4_9MICO|nr:PLP-dependent aminotransferase family protein [Luteipulveratus sp. YIM 133296]MDF8264361.1 PLP-dependent aminotransferase family protein [Luteipulveratus sp. YIM 133296]